MAFTKRVRVVRPEDEEIFAEPPTAVSSEAPQVDDDIDFDQELDEDEEPIDRATTVPKVLELLNKLDVGVRSLVHFGNTFRYRRDKFKRRDKIMKQIEDIRTAIQFDEFMSLKREGGE